MSNNIVFVRDNVLIRDAAERCGSCQNLLQDPQRPDARVSICYHDHIRGAHQVRHALHAACWQATVFFSRECPLCHEAVANYIQIRDPRAGLISVALFTPPVYTTIAQPMEKSLDHPR